MASTLESDEQYARRLQAQEMGLNDITPLMINSNEHLHHHHHINNIHINNNNHQNQNPTVIDARLNELSSSRAKLCAILTVNLPQILASIIILSLHWNDNNICDEAHTSRWKIWALLSAIRLFSFSALVIFMITFKNWLDERHELNSQLLKIKNLIDALGLIWFVVGNMWLLGDEDNCINPERSPIYGLCLSMLIINYIQICLPCIIAIIMIPVFCFCMPCLIRVLARLHDPHAVSGANDAAIDAIQLVTINDDNVSQLNGENSTCPICLNEMIIGEEARVMECKHIFHKQCLDEWLRVNASCPTCRKSIFNDNNNNSNSNSNSSNSSNNSNDRINIGSSSNNNNNNSGHQIRLNFSISDHRTSNL
jgi:E3 ubiquitin-protein ligase RNF38/44